MESFLVLGEVSSEAAAAAAGFGFGFLAGIGVLWWPIFLLVVLFESFFLTKNSAKEEFGSALFVGIVALATLHIFGVLDVVTYAKEYWETIIRYFLYYLAFGLFVYAPLRGWLTVRKHRADFTKKLRDAKKQYMTRSYAEDGQKPLSDQEKEALWDTKVKAEKWAEIKSVDNDKNRVFDWIVFWFFDFVGKFIFQFLERLEDLFHLCWRAVRGIAQFIKDSALKGADTDI